MTDLMLFIAIWCGNPNAASWEGRSKLTVDDCRDRMTTCMGIKDGDTKVNFPEKLVACAKKERL
jgi:hypothetical protein